MLEAIIVGKNVSYNKLLSDSNFRFWILSGGDVIYQGNMWDVLQKYFGCFDDREVY